mgnify:CR=1 FL=1
MSSVTYKKGKGFWFIPPFPFPSAVAKRFTDTEKWKKHWFRNLPRDYKLLWLYILDDCNCAGIWDVDLEVAQIRCKVEVSESRVLKYYKDRIEPIENGVKWFIPNFIDWQYGKLSEKCNYHQKPIKLLKKYNLYKNEVYGMNDGINDTISTNTKISTKIKAKIKGGFGGKNESWQESKESSLYLQLERLIKGDIISGSIPISRLELYKVAIKDNPDIEYWSRIIKMWTNDDSKYKPGLRTLLTVEVPDKYKKMIMVDMTEKDRNKSFNDKINAAREMAATPEERSKIIKETFNVRQ